MSGHFNDLISEFARLPGIGTRQARRIVEHLIRKDGGSLSRLSRLLSEIKSAMHECDDCRRLFTSTGGQTRCAICSDNTRERTLMVVEKDVDLETIEKNGIYQGTYFVVGALITLTEKNPAEKIQVKKLIRTIDELPDGAEIILALSTTTDGEETALYIEEQAKELIEKKSLLVTRLGRGLSTGAEIEYADPITIKNALTNRK